MPEKRSRFHKALPFLIPLVLIGLPYAAAAILKVTLAMDILALLLYIYSLWLWAFLIIRGLARDYWNALLTYFLQISLIFSQFVRIYSRTGILDAAGQIATGTRVHQYFSALALLGVSYGDFKPAPASRIWVVLESLLGYFSLALFIILIVLVVEKTRKQPQQKPKRKRPPRKKRMLFRVGIRA